MRYNIIRQLDIANGPGCRVSLFVQGCSFNCLGCFNAVARDFEGGTAFTDQTFDLLVELAKPSHISGLSILGGEPLHPQNREGVFELIRKFKEIYPEKNVWVWTGYTWEEIWSEVAGTGIDVLVDGRYVAELRDPRLKYRGSSNQRVIDVSASTRDLIIMKE